MATSDQLPRTGHPQLDSDHEELSRLLGTLAAAFARGDVTKAREITGLAVSGIADHFAREEELMWALRYPQLGRHKDAHDLFLGDVARFHDELQTQGLSPLARAWAESRLVEWFRLHVAAQDVPLGEFLARHDRVASAAPALALAGPAPASAPARAPMGRPTA